ncbi:hypothetical protein NP493_71g00031 [Ridgeia piscesae]|uniref:Uncharacterized protein n=1 Tax=Ridgeia piscesae TaxID=27915 RepID=A0AAD9P9Z3_RIDPI|nr:hypothetical protein NP493_71g00031 [Ridgeia piscesae]
MRHNCTTGPRHLGGLGEEVADELQCAQVSRPISHNEVLASQGSTQYYTSWPWTVASATDLAAELNADLHWGKHIQATVARQSEQTLHIRTVSRATLMRKRMSGLVGFMPTEGTLTTNNHLTRRQPNKLLLPHSRSNTPILPLIHPTEEQDRHAHQCRKDQTDDTYGISTDIRANGEKLDCVNRFKYVGAIIADERSKPEILTRIAQITAALAKLKTICNGRNIALSSEIKLVMSIFLYACESWTLTADTERRIQAMEMRCLRKLLGITYKDHISNEERATDIGVCSTLEVEWPVLCCAQLQQQLQEMVFHGFPVEQRRPKKRWEDNIPEWTGMTLGAAEESREEWRELVVICGAPMVHQTIG